MSKITLLKVWVRKQFSLIPKPMTITPDYSVLLVMIYTKQIFDLLKVSLDCVYHSKLHIAPFCKGESKLSQKKAKLRKDQKRACMRSAGKAEAF